jgi:hypothetical protein
MLLGAIYQWVYWREFLGEPASPEDDERFLATVLDTLDRAILLPED